MGLVINLKADTGLVDRTENTTRYYKDISDYPTLSKEEEIEWFNKMRHGATEKERKFARDYIFLCNQRLAIAAAKKWAKTDTLMDFVNEANFGLSEAIDKFDPTKNVKFASYAMWFVLRAINNYCNGSMQLVKRTNLSKVFHVISKARNDFMQDFEREPTTEELFELVTTKYNKDIQDKNDLLDLKYSYVDDTSNEEEDKANYGDIAAYNKKSAAYNDYETTETEEFHQKMVSSILSKLSPRKQTIIKMRFGIYDDNGLKREYEREEIGNKLGLTSERVRQLEMEALAEIKEEYTKRVGKL